MVDTVKKFSFAGNEAVKTPPKGPAPQRGGTEFDMGKGVAGISEMLKEIDTVRAQGQEQGPTTMGQGGGGFAVAEGGPILNPDVIAATERILQNKIDAETPDALGLGKEDGLSSFLTRAQNIKAKRNEAMSSTEGVMSSLFDLAGMIAGIAGIHNASPALSLIGGKLGQEGKTMADNILDPFRQEEALLYKEFADEIAGAKEGEFTPQQRASSTREFAKSLAGDKFRGADLGDLDETIDIRSGMLPYDFTPAEREAIKDTVVKTRVDPTAEATPGAISDIEQNAIDLMSDQIKGALDSRVPSDQKDTTELREVALTRQRDKLNPELDKWLRKTNIGLDPGIYRNSPKTRKLAIEKAFTETIQPTSSEGTSRGVIGGATKERLFMSDLLGLPDPGETIHIPDDATIRDKTKLLNGVDETTTAEELFDTIFNNWEKMAENTETKPGQYIVTAPMLTELGTATFWTTSRKPVDIRVFKEESSTPFSKETIKVMFDSAIDEVRAKGLQMDAKEYTYFSAVGLSVMRHLLAETRAEFDEESVPAPRSLIEEALDRKPFTTGRLEKVE